MGENGCKGGWNWVKMGEMAGNGVEFGWNIYAWEGQSMLHWAFILLIVLCVLSVCFFVCVCVGNDIVLGIKDCCGRD